MGLVYNQVGTWVKAYAAGVEKVKEAVITPGQATTDITVETVSREEIDELAKKLDVLANYRQNEAIAAMVAKSFPAIVTALRWVKAESVQEFRGMKAVGKQLDVAWLVPEDIGGTILDKDQGSNKHAWAEASGYTKWLPPAVFAVGTAKPVIPEQTMKDEAACVHLGMIDTVAIPKVNKISFTVSGQRAPDQSLSFTHTDGSELSFQEYEYPVIVGPKQQQKVEVDGYIAGDSKPELLTLLIAMAEDLAFTLV